MNAPEKLLFPTAPTTATAGPAAGVSRPHESAAAQVAGSATYVDDIGEIRGTLFAAPVLSTVAHGRLLGVDVTAALAMPGVYDVILARDIPGHPMLASFVGDEPIFASTEVQHVGQVVGVVVASMDAASPARNSCGPDRDPQHRAAGKPTGDTLRTGRGLSHS